MPPGSYETEYSKEVLTISCSSVKPGDRVVIFDDLIATGGTTIAAADLIVQAGGIVAEVMSVCLYWCVCTAAAAAAAVSAITPN